MERFQRLVRDALREGDIRSQRMPRFENAIPPGIDDDWDLIPRVADANQMLYHELGSTSSPVEADWSVEITDGIRAYRLRIKDWSGEASATFSREDLHSEKLVKSRIIRLWGDLLQIRSHKQLEALGQSKVRPDGEDVLDMISDAIYDFTEKNGTQPHVLKLPTQYAVALMRLGSSFWGGFFERIRETGVRAIDNQSLFGVSVNLVNGVDANLEVE